MAVTAVTTIQGPQQATTILSCPPVNRQTEFPITSAFVTSCSTSLLSWAGIKPAGLIRKSRRALPRDGLSNCQ
jgi:hypothetical protein